VQIAQKKKKKFTSIFIGLIPGLILPLITVYLFFIVKYSKDKTFNEFIDMIHYFGVTTKIISLCVIPNLLLFFVFIWTDRYNPGKGVILATFIYTGIVLIMKYL
jgi:heme/copper-type cytochrome/quinol oxidase subunit 2